MPFDEKGPIAFADYVGRLRKAYSEREREGF
jgi:hypothetical protein